MTERDMLLKKIGTLKFAVADIDMFLDTHPGDTEMLKKREEYIKQMRPLTEDYEQRFGPLTKKDNMKNTWAWVKDPWPWDMEV